MEAQLEDPCDNVRGGGAFKQVGLALAAPLLKLIIYHQPDRWIFLECLDALN